MSDAEQQELREYLENWRRSVMAELEQKQQEIAASADLVAAEVQEQVDMAVVLAGSQVHGVVLDASEALSANAAARVEMYMKQEISQLLKEIQAAPVAVASNAQAPSRVVWMIVGGLLVWGLNTEALSGVKTAYANVKQFFSVVTK